MKTGGRALLAIGGLTGAAGVALAAAASHVGGPNLSTAAQFLLFHAPALAVVALISESTLLSRRMALGAGVLMAIGLLLFSGSLAAGALANWRPFPLSAPTGGFALIGGWLLLAVAALTGRR